MLELKEKLKNKKVAELNEQKELEKVQKVDFWLTNSNSSSNKQRMRLNCSAKALMMISKDAKPSLSRKGRKFRRKRCRKNKRRKMKMLTYYDVLYGIIVTEYSHYLQHPKD